MDFIYEYGARRLDSNKRVTKLKLKFGRKAGNSSLLMAMEYIEGWCARKDIQFEKGEWDVRYVGSTEARHYLAVEDVTD